MKRWENTLWSVTKDKIATEVLCSYLQRSPLKAKICIDLVSLSKNSYDNLTIPSNTDYHKDLASDWKGHEECKYSTSWGWQIWELSWNRDMTPKPNQRNRPAFLSPRESCYGIYWTQLWAPTQTSAWPTMRHLLYHRTGFLQLLFDHGFDPRSHGAFRGILQGKHSLQVRLVAV